MRIGDLVADPRALPGADAGAGDLAAVASGDDDLALDLLHDFDGLARALPRLIEGASWIDAFLVAAGMHQILEDHLADPHSLALVHKRLRRMPAAGGAAALVLRAGARGLAWRRATSAATEVAARLASLTVGLADAVSGAEPARDALRRDAGAIRAALPALDASLRREIQRIPSCFRSFDLMPADIERLADAFTRSFPDRSRAIVALGIRTSGGYIAPLMRAYLSRRGYANVRVATRRPGQLTARAEERIVTDAVRRDGLIVVLDDPPNTGGSLRKIVAELRARGVDHRAIVLAVPLFEEQLAVSDLADIAAVTLPWSHWSIHERLAPDNVFVALGALLRDRGIEVRAVRRLEAPVATQRRRHARALYRVIVRDRGREIERDVYAKGAGLGYFGAHAAAVRRRLGASVADVYGVADGVVYREWLSADALAADALGPGELAQRIGRYAAARSRALAVGEDKAERLFARGTAWRRAAEILARAHGGAAPLALPATALVAKRLLRVERASIVDGTMDRTRWFVRDGSGEVVKVSADHRAFASREQYCYDAAFDVASAAIDLDGAADTLRDAFVAAGGAPIDAERWLLYQLVHLAAAARERPDTLGQRRVQMSVALQRYLARTVFADAVAPADGPVCAIDVDGVLETGELGFPAMPPAAALALRALARHRYRVVLATGRSVAEVRSRVASYPVAAGVAEYGAAVVDRSGAATEIARDAARRDIEVVRERLAALSGVRTDPGYAVGVRAYRLVEGRRLGLDDDAVAALVDATAVTTVRGRSQTDFVPAGSDKGAGVRIALAGLGVAPGERPLRFAVGDSAADLPMLRLAERAYVPESARPLARDGVRAVRGRCVSGFVRAVELELGHRIGGCERCAPPALSPEARLLLGALAPAGLDPLPKARATFALLRDAARL